MGYPDDDLRDIAFENPRYEDYCRVALAFAKDEGIFLTEEALRRAFDALNAQRRPPAGERKNAGRGGGGQGTHVLPEKTTARGGLLSGPLDPSQWHAPFRFISLSQKVAEPEAVVKTSWMEGSLHDRPLPDGLCATLEVAWEFDGPMLIGNGKENAEPLKVAGHHVLPGSTLRGLLRSTLEIAAMGCLEQVDGHRAFGMRDFNHKLFKDDTRPEVKGGWLQKRLDAEGREICEIAPCRIHEILIRDMHDGRSSGMDHAQWLCKELIDKYRMLDMALPGSGDKEDPPLDFTVAQSFSSTSKQLVRRDANGAITGIFVCAGRSPTIKANDETVRRLDSEQATNAKGQSKKVEYVFEDRGNGVPFEVNGQEWRDFIDMNSTVTRNTPRPAGNWAHLSPTFESGRRIPVFWIGTPGNTDFDFGLVKVFKRRLKYRLRDLIPPLHGQDWQEPDFVQALMGYVREPTPGASREEKSASHPQRHLRSRVSIGFAKLEGPAPKFDSLDTVQAVPKPSFGPFYLRGTPLKDWNEDVRIAGRKRYPAYDGSSANVLSNLRALVTNENRKIQSHLTFLSPPAGRKLRFRGEIRLHNVTEAELGAVIWALTLGGDPALRHSIGRAKAQGAGQARVVKLALRAERNDGKPFEGAAEGWEAGFGATGVSLAPFVTAFGEAMRRTDPLWPDVVSVQEMLATCDPKGKGHDRRDYMALKGAEPTYPKLRQAAYDKGKGHSGPDCLLAPGKRKAIAGRKGE